MTHFKIHSGIHRGMILQTPPGMQTRPSKAIVRDATMNMLEAGLDGGLEGKVFWDLFAGTGAIGLEGLSRGLSQVIFFEDDRAAIKALNLNIDELTRRALKQNLGKPEILLVPQSLFSVQLKFERFTSPDIIWLDPPYQIEASALAGLFERISVALSKPCQLILECGLESPLTLQVPNNWEQRKIKNYGKTSITWWSISGVKNPS